jgi:hypothetical protein
MEQLQAPGLCFFRGFYPMALPESMLTQPASSRYSVSVLGGDTVFLVDLCIGQKLHMSADRPLSRPEFRRYLSSLEHDVKNLTIGEFFDKYGLRG